MVGEQKGAADGDIEFARVYGTKMQTQEEGPSTPERHQPALRI